MPLHGIAWCLGQDEEQLRARIEIRPGEAQWQRDLSVGHTKVVDFAAKSGDAAKARAESTAARMISARPASLAPDNAA